MSSRTAGALPATPSRKDGMETTWSGVPLRAARYERCDQRLEVLRRTRGHHSVPRIQVERRLDAAVLQEVHERARLARNQLPGGGIDGAAGPGRDHAVEA